jgi:hypothetical protein
MIHRIESERAKSTAERKIDIYSGGFTLSPPSADISKKANKQREREGEKVSCGSSESEINNNGERNHMKMMINHERGELSLYFGSLLKRRLFLAHRQLITMCCAILINSPPSPSFFFFFLRYL